MNDIELQRLERCKKCSMSVITDDFIGLGIMELVCPLHGFECNEVVQMNRESICKQQIHCLSCPLSVRITGKDCRTLTHKELIEMIVREPDNLCVICGAQIPEGRQVCPICGTKDNIEGYAQLIRKPKPAPEFKVDDTQEQAFRQGYLTGFNEGMKVSCELKQQNAQLRKDNAILRAAIERRDSENNQDGWYE